MMTRNPSLIPTLALATGIALSSGIGIAWWCGIIPITSAIGLYILILNKSGNPVATFKLGKWHIMWTAILFLGIGMLDESLSRPTGIANPRPEYVECEVREIQAKTYGDRIELLIKGTNGTKAQIRTGITDLRIGNIVNIPARRLIETAKDTSIYVSRIAPMLKAKGVMYTGWIPRGNIVTTGHSRALRYRVCDLREYIETAIERSSLDKPTADFLNAILMGDKNGLDDSIRVTFANGGTAHMLALSGLHLGIIASLFMWIMLPLRAAGRYKWGYGVAIIALWAYVIITGMSPSSVRACVMITFAFIAVITERKNSIPAALTSACLLILIVSPTTLFDAGFQLSVVCVAALTAFATRLNPIDHRKHPRIFKVSESLLATMTATAASWALISYYFGQIPLMFLPANLLLLPFLPFYLGLGAIYTLLLCAGYDFTPAVIFLNYGYDLLIWATEVLSGESRFVVDYQLPLWGVALWTALLALAAIVLNRKSMTKQA